MRCPRCETSLSVIKKGYFQRKNTPAEKRQRFLCKSCKSQFSQTSGSLDEGQKRPDLHHPIFMLLISGVSQRRAAKLCSTTQITVARKLVRMAKFSQAAHAVRLAGMRKSVKIAVFDEMEAFEHSKCKPVAIAVAVEEGSRIILSATAASMPAKGRLAAISHVASADLLVKSDQCPRYPKLVRQHLPGAKHKTFKGRGRSGRLVRWWLSRQAQSCRAVYEVPCRRYQVQWHTDLKTACHTVFDQRTFPARYNNACRRFIF